MHGYRTRVIILYVYCVTVGRGRLTAIRCGFASGVYIDTYSNAIFHFWEARLERNVDQSCLSKSPAGGIEPPWHGHHIEIECLLMGECSRPCARSRQAGSVCLLPVRRLAR